MFTLRATRLAACATVAFATAAVVGALVTVHDWAASSPLLGFHVLLLIQTYFSIRCFSSIVPRPTAAQIAIDGVLVALYVYLPFQFADATHYLWASAVLFLVATIKYALMLRPPGYVRPLIRKIMLDLLAAAACGLALAGESAGLPLALECWLGVFVLANIYILLMSRIYAAVANEVPSL